VVVQATVAWSARSRPHTDGFYRSAVYDGPMSETTDRVPATCPSCSPGAETVHEVLRSGGQATVRCTECDHVHKTRIERERTAEIDVVVSQGGESTTATADVPAEETLSVGDEFVLETEAAILTVRITSLELEEGGRAESAEASAVATIWTRDVGNVEVDVTLHPKEGTGDDTRSVALPVPGDETFTVGETTEIGDEEFTVETLLPHDDADSELDQLERPGDTLPAKDCKRVYARDETGDAWSMW
jgi:uncharacterized Zn finger protein